MKIIYTLVLIVSVSFIRNGYGQTQEVTIKDSTVLQVVSSFMDSLKLAKNDLGVITLEITNLNIKRSKTKIEDNDPRFNEVSMIKETLSYQIKAVLQLNLLYFKYHLPNFYFTHRGKIILVYTGTDKFIEPSTKAIDHLQKILKDKLPKHGTSLCPTWWIDVNESQIKFERKGLS